MNDKLRLKLKIVIPPDFSEITPGLFLGEVVSALNIEDLEEHGISAVVNCSTSARNCFNELDYFNVSVLDSGDVKSVSQLASNLHPSAEFINEKLEGGQRVLVHCHRGLSRSPTIIAAFLMLFKNFTLEEALFKINQKRFVKPRDEFKTVLVNLEEQINNLK